jgi:DNA-binding transcriptional MerR regulator
MGLLSPRRRDQVRIYSQREKARLQLIRSGRRAGFTLNEIRELFETYDKSGPDAQMELKRREIDDALEALNAASDRMAAKLGAIVGSSYLLDGH